MSEQDFLPSGRSDLEAMASGVGSEPTAGSLLRAARQAQGVDIAALAAALKVPVDKLQALEDDRFDLLLDAVFMRALASGVCRLLKLDPNPILERLPPLHGTRVTSQNWGINEPFRSRSGAGASSRSRLSMPVILVGIALLLGALVLVFLPVIQQGSPVSAGQEASSPTTAEPLSADTPSTVQETVQNSGLAVPGSPSGQPPLFAAGTAPTAGALPSAAAPAPAAAPASAAGLAQATPGAADAVAVFKATGESWVKVTDAKGVTVLGRTLQAGESVGVSGALPLRVVIGRADAVQVQVRGQMLDMKALSPDNVARFEVK